MASVTGIVNEPLRGYEQYGNDVSYKNNYSIHFPGMQGFVEGVKRGMKGYLLMTEYYPKKY